MRNILKNVNFELRLIGLLLFIFSLKAFQACNSDDAEQPARDWKTYNDSLLKPFDGDSISNSNSIKKDSVILELP